MTNSRHLLRHFLAALAYRTQKALRGAPPAFGDFRAAPTSRSPAELLWHMSGLIGYARIARPVWRPVIGPRSE